MADGVAAKVTIAPSDGPKVRGTAAGLGVSSVDTDLMSRPELFEARRTGDIGLVHSWELVTSVDGPGTRMTIFMAGCPLRCLYCHNPDTWELKEGTLHRVEDLVKKIKRYRPVFNASGGGITISGGEPLFQIAFTRRVLAEAHAAGIHTCIDSAGYLGARLSDEDLENIDLVLLDVKSGLPDTYERLTGHELAPSIAFGDRLNKLGKRVWVRHVHVPGYTDAPENVEAMADIVARWKDNVERVEILPFHNMGRDKWHELGIEYELENLSPPSRESTDAIRDVFRSRGLTVY
ncbi:pyruvate formate-lyase-activating protein [Corynebacterium epidermidicanis]|uniref:Pyruvate formate-lyase-activating enzyme n=1 Tax=Corynebacterium epidermidicanis TaxID=1050174 RepID=A0A0G3GPJ9_9CORY|nr:pyruvate formate-lyase-activating protein [Corynebacterium epidermidicanis]AKK03099.1 pyruvate formate-lyase 1-activating enzyme [Corynebacterium epidermidicanis]